MGRCLEAGEEAAGGVVRGEERRVGALAEAFAEDMPTGSPSLESAPGAAIVEPTMEVSRKSDAEPSCLCALGRSGRVQLFVTPCTVARQAPLSVGLSRLVYWSGLPCPLPGDLPDPGIEPASLTSPALASGFFTTSATWEVQSYHMTQ